MNGGKLFKSAKEIRDTFESRGMTLDGISAHCPFWVHTSAWTGTKSGNPFIAPDIAKKTPQEIENAFARRFRRLFLAAAYQLSSVAMIQFQFR